MIINYTACVHSFNMAAFRGDQNFLRGDELEAYLDAFLEDDNDIDEDYSKEDDVETTEDILCSCGKPALQRTAKCSMVHYTCRNDNRAALDRSIDESEANSSLCDCCKISLHIIGIYNVSLIIHYIRFPLFVSNSF